MGGTSTLLDPQQQQAFIAQLPVQQLLPNSTQQPQTTEPRSADLSPAGTDFASSGTDDLENRRAVNIDATGQLLRGTQTQNLQLQDQLGQAQQQLQDSFQKIASGLADQYQQLQTQRSTGIKRMLKSFFGGMGAAMMHDASLASPEDQQANILQPMMLGKVVQSVDALRLAQAP
jgi:hypothetical protein